MPLPELNLRPAPDPQDSLDVTVLVLCEPYEPMFGVAGEKQRELPWPVRRTLQKHAVCVHIKVTGSRFPISDARLRRIANTHGFAVAPDATTEVVAPTSETDYLQRWVTLRIPNECFTRNPVPTQSSSRRAPAPQSVLEEAIQ